MHRMSEGNLNTVFNLITAHTLYVHSQAVPYFSGYGQCTFCLLLYKGICCGYPFELHQLVDAIQMSTHSICFSQESQKKNKTKTTKTHTHTHTHTHIALVSFDKSCAGFFFKEYP